MANPSSTSIPPSAPPDPEIDWNAYFLWQAAGCRRDGSPLYAALLERIAADHSNGGVIADLFSEPS